MINLNKSVKVWETHKIDSKGFTVERMFDYISEIKCGCGETKEAHEIWLEIAEKKLYRIRIVKIYL